MYRNRSRPSRTVGAAAAAVLVAAGLVGCSSDEPGSNSSGDDPFRILVVYPLSGPLAQIGAAGRMSVTAAIRIVNDEGGINGRQVEATFVDTAGTPTQAVSVLQQELASGTTYDFGILGQTSTEAIPMMQVATANKLVSCSSAGSDALNDPQKYPYFFGSATSTSGTAAGVVNQVKDEGYTKVSGLFADNELGVAALAAVERELDEANIPFVSEKLDPAATDATAQLEKLRAENPDVLLLDAYGPVAAVMLSSVKKLGWDIPVIGTADLAANDFSSIPAESYAGISINAVSYNVAGSPATQTPEFQAFRQAMIAESGGDLPFAAEVYGSAFSCVLLARAAATIAGSTDPDAMKTALESVKTADQVKGWFACTNIDFSPTNHKPAYAAEDYVKATPGPREQMLLPATS